MKKRILSFALTLTIILALVPASAPTAVAETYGDWEYSGDTVTNYIGTAEFAVVPSVINGIQITTLEPSWWESDNSQTLKNITIPSSVKYIWGLSMHRNLMNINVDPDNPRYTSIDGVLYTKDTKALMSYPAGRTGSITVPNHVIYIGFGSLGDYDDYVDYPGGDQFRNSRLTSITIPNSVTHIGPHAFASSSLISITISSSVTGIVTGYYYYGSAFEDCRSLTSINVDSNNPYYSSVGGVLYNKNQTQLLHYPVGKPDNSFVMPNSVTNIEWLAFEGCNLKSVTIPNSVKYIEDGAFAKCKDLTSIAILSSELSIYDGAFSECTSLEAVYFASAIPPMVFFDDSYDDNDDLYSSHPFRGVAPGARAIVPYGATEYGPVGSFWGGDGIVEYGDRRIQDGLIVAYDRSEWANPELERAAEIGLIPESLQGPGIDYSRPITRAEFAGIAVRTYEILSGTAVLPAINDPFTDTSDIDALKAYNAGIMVGMSATTFEPHTRLNREQAATALTRVFKRATIPTWTFATDVNYPLTFTYPAPFVDDAQISDWARESVYFMNANGIIQGMGSNMFQPRATTNEQEAQGYATATREQAIAIALRMIENLG